MDGDADLPCPDSCSPSPTARGLSGSLSDGIGALASTPCLRSDPLSWTGAQRRSWQTRRSRARALLREDRHRGGPAAWGQRRGPAELGQQDEIDRSQGHRELPTAEREELRRLRRPAAGQAETNQALRKAAVFFAKESERRARCTRSSRRRRLVWSACSVLVERARSAAVRWRPVLSASVCSTTARAADRSRHGSPWRTGRAGSARRPQASTRPEE